MNSFIKSKKYFIKSKLFLISLIVIVCFHNTNSFCQGPIIKNQPIPNTSNEIDKSDHPELAAEHEFNLTKDPSLGYVPKERLINAYNIINEQKRMKKSKTLIQSLSSATWVERGPTNVGGRTRAIMFDPNDPQLKKVWAGGADGGLWFTDDITASDPQWENKSDLWKNIAISCIAFNPANTQEFYVGTGEGWCNEDAVRGTGIWKSSDGGNSWNQIPETNNSNFYHIQKIVISNIGDIYVATREDGVYRYSIINPNWTKVLGIGLGASSNRAADIEIGKDDSLYATMGIFETDGIYRSKNGTAWNKLNTNLSGFPTSGFHRIEIACAPSNANKLYAMVQRSNKDSEGGLPLLNIYTSSDKGSSWTILNTPSWHDGRSLLDCFIPSVRDITKGQAWYNLIIAVDPSNENNVLIGGVDLFKSSNGGNDWSQLSDWGIGCFPKMHADQHAVIYQPGSSSKVVIGNDGGVYYSENINTLSPTFKNKNKGYNISQFYSCAIHPISGVNYFLAGAQDNGTQKFISKNLNSTTDMIGGDGSFCFIDQTNPKYQIASYTHNNFYRSTNGGGSFHKIYSDINKTGLFINPADYDDKNHILYSSFSINQLQRISGIMNNRTNNPELLTINPMSAIATHIRVSPYSPIGTTTLFIGNGNGKLYKVKNAQGTPSTADISDISGASFPLGSISCVEIGATEDDLIVTFSNYGVTSVWRTTTGGLPGLNGEEPWSDVEGNLCDMPVRWAIYNPNNLSEVLLATEAGVWSTENINSSSPFWVVSDNNLDNVRVDMFQLRKSDNELIAATHGRGLFSTSIFGNSKKVDFDASVNTILAQNNISFTDISTINPTSWNWSFPGGENFSANSPNPTVTYNAPGIYPVTLSVTSENGDSTVTKTSFITVNAITPSNDNCANAIELTSTVICNLTSGTVDGATDDGFPNQPLCDDFGPLSAQFGVFYYFVAQSSTETITINPTGTLDAVLTLYTGSDCYFLQEVECIDTHGGNGVPTILTASGLTIGQTYWIRVYDYGSFTTEDGNFTICITHEDESNNGNQLIIKYEYWFDNNYAGKTSVNINPVSNLNLASSISIQSLSQGIHSIHFRFKDGNNNWSSATTNYFNYDNIQTPPPILPNVISYEYWTDNNYVGKTTNNVSASSNLSLTETIPVSSLNQGIHSIHFRFKDDLNKWSSATTNYFNYDNALTIPPVFPNIVSYEYWIDNNYAGKISNNVSPSSNISLANAIPVNSLNQGIHSIHFRFKDDNEKWSSETNHYFNFDNIPFTPVDRKIVSYEYWWDNDYPGKTSIDVNPVTNLNLSTPLSLYSLSPGLHSLHFRFKDDSDSWSAVAENNSINILFLHMKAYIEGYYKGNGQMESVLFKSGSSNDLILCDTITVELHNAISPYELIYSTSNTIDIYGDGKFIIPNNLTGNNYYIVVKHRNSIETWSKTPVQFNGSVVDFDFTR